jgi:anti-sigma B factor antagonist
MAIGRGQPATGHGATAPLDALVQLSSQIGADGLAVVTIRGDLDLATAEPVVRYVKKIIDRHDGPVSADLSGVAFCDACGLGALIRIAAYAEQAGRRLVLARPSRAVARIMRLTHVDSWLLEPALAGLGAAAATARG